MACVVMGTGTVVGTGMGVCVVAEYDAGDADGVVAADGGTLFLSSSPGDDLFAGVATISRVTGDRRRHWAIQQRCPRLNTLLPCGGRLSRLTLQVVQLDFPQ